MASGLRVGNACLSPQAAADSLYSVAPRAVFQASSGQSGEIAYEVCSGSPSDWCRVSRVGGVVQSSTAVEFPALPSCDMYEGFFDGVQFGWLVLSVMVAIAAFRVMRQGAK